MHLPEECKIVKIGVPKSYASAALATEWLNMGKYRSCDFVIQAGAWAGGTAAVTIKEAVNASGSSSAALALAEYWTNKSSTSVDTYVKTTVSSNTFTLGTANQTAVIHVSASELTDGKDFLNLAIASPGANADFYSVVAILTNPRYVSDSPLTAQS